MGKAIGINVIGPSQLADTSDSSIHVLDPSDQAIQTDLVDDMRHIILGPSLSPCCCTSILREGNDDL